jgi:hypothetical protein
MLKKKLFKNKILLIIFILILFFLKFNDFFRNTYFIFKNDHTDRLIYRYNICQGNSYPFLYIIKKKFNIKGIPKIVNFAPNPNLEWIFLNNKKIEGNNNDNFLILLNYSEEIKYNFTQKGDYLENINSYDDGIFKKIKFVEIELNENSQILQNKIKNLKINFFQSKFGGNKYFIGNILLKEKLSKKNKYKIIFNFNENIDFNISSRMKKIHLTILNNNQNFIGNIKSLKIISDNHYNLENYKIVYSYKNCFLTKL